MSEKDEIDVEALDGETMDPHVPTGLLDLYVQLDEEGLSPDEFKEAMA